VLEIALYFVDRFFVAAEVMRSNGAVGGLAVVAVIS
jgi:hypothetical protein